MAISQTNAGGEVIVLDSAGYGPTNITKAISIIASPGVYAGISVFSGDGIDINAGASDTVILRGLTVNNQGSIQSGIVFITGGTLHVENCVINGFSGPNGASGVQLVGPGGRLEVKDSIIRGSGIGILVLPSSGMAFAAVDQVRLERCGEGLSAGKGSTVTVRNSVASGNGNGFDAGALGGTVELNLDNCIASNNSAIGIVVSSVSGGFATVRVSNSTITDNAVGLSSSGSGAVLLSRGNNTVEGNATDISGAIGSYTAK
jgi:hypothetical protein